MLRGTGAGGRWQRWWWWWWHLMDTHMEEGHCKWNSINIQINETFAQLLPLQFRHTFSLMDMMIIIIIVVVMMIIVMVVMVNWSNHCSGMFQRLGEVLRIKTCAPINGTQTNVRTFFIFTIIPDNPPKTHDCNKSMNVGKGELKGKVWQVFLDWPFLSPPNPPPLPTYPSPF